MALTNLPNPNNHFPFLKSLFFGIICSSIAISHGVEGPAKNGYHVVNVDSLVPKPYCTKHGKGSSLGSQKLVVTSRYGPCSRSPGTNQISSYDEALVNDAARVESLNSKNVSKYHSKYAAESGSTLQVSQPFPFGGQYHTTIGLGTPKVDYNVIIDTGSDYTWVRCKPCAKGCKSQNSLFDPSKSSTYSNGPCIPLSDPFKMEYRDHTSTSGHWGCDKLSLQHYDVFEKFQFGCGQINNGGSHNFANEAGYLGLGRGDLSLVSQTASNFGKTFSYCLPRTSSSKGYIEFGDRAISKTSSSGLKFTSLIRKNDPWRSLYFVQLLGISVAGIRLNVASTVFTSVGTVIDSGTVLTYLPASAYIALRTAFNQSMAEYPPAEPQKRLDTCYNVKGNTNVRLPDIVFHFGGGTDVSLNPSGIVFIPPKKPYIWCLGFTANVGDDLTIIGNNQQREIDILYDIDAGRIGFGTKPCGGG